MFDYKAKCEELTVAYVNQQRKIEELKHEKEWIRSILAFALEHVPAIVVREDELKNAPEIEFSENLSNELIIRIRRK